VRPFGRRAVSLRVSRDARRGTAGISLRPKSRQAGSAATHQPDPAPSRRRRPRHGQGPPCVAGNESGGLCGSAAFAAASGTWPASPPASESRSPKAKTRQIAGRLLPAPHRPARSRGPRGGHRNIRSRRLIGVGHGALANRLIDSRSAIPGPESLSLDLRHRRAEGRRRRFRLIARQAQQRPAAAIQARTQLFSALRLNDSGSEQAPQEVAVAIHSEIDDRASGHGGHRSERSNPESIAANERARGQHHLG
jgi:hypothetical protein